MSHYVRASLPLLLLFAGGSLQAQVLCYIPTSGEQESFYVMETPTEVCPKRMRPNEQVYGILDCTSSGWSATCEAWPMVYPVKPGDEDKLQYTWRVTQGGVTTTYPESNNASLSFSCSPLQNTFVQVTVRNGTASDSDTVGFRCGDDPH
jgi:hypothetical protein